MQLLLYAGGIAFADAERGERIWDSWLGEKTFYQDPLYAYFLAILYALFGPSVGAAVLVGLVVTVSPAAGRGGSRQGGTGGGPTLSVSISSQ